MGMKGLYYSGISLTATRDHYPFPNFALFVYQSAYQVLDRVNQGVNYSVFLRIASSFLPKLVLHIHRTLSQTCAPMVINLPLLKTNLGWRMYHWITFGT